MRSCGQDVYSQGTRNWITCVFVSTGGKQTTRVTQQPAYNPQFIHNVLPNSSPMFSTEDSCSITSVLARLIHVIHSTYNYPYKLKKGKSI